MIAIGRQFGCGGHEIGRILAEKLGFQIFTRTSKGAALTPAGAQFCTTLRNIRTELKRPSGKEGMRHNAGFIRENTDGWRWFPCCPAKSTAAGNS